MFTLPSTPARNTLASLCFPLLHILSWQGCLPRHNDTHRVEVISCTCLLLVILHPLSFVLIWIALGCLVRLALVPCYSVLVGFALRCVPTIPRFIPPTLASTSLCEPLILVLRHQLYWLPLRLEIFLCLFVPIGVFGRVLWSQPPLLVFCCYPLAS